MAIRIVECAQGSDEWHQARAGKVTASRVSDVLAKGKGVSRRNYLAELVAERLSGMPTPDRFQSQEMRDGSRREADARDLYALMRDVDPVQVGFVLHPTIEMAGASPDSLIGEDGMLEIKCPTVATHLDTLRGGFIAGRYFTQMQFQMACTGRQWCDYGSYHPDLPPEMQLHIKRVLRDTKVILEMEVEITMFLAEVEKATQALRERYPSPASEAAA